MLSPTPCIRLFHSLILTAIVSPKSMTRVVYVMSVEFTVRYELNMRVNSKTWRTVYFTGAKPYVYYNKTPNTVSRKIYNTTFCHGSTMGPAW